ncbi:hypothetical protein GSI_07533 [Ganoderma sinense ZZ0214-1]|uniref:Uncharacterized protein n=1 Tax=Ganoderma sinense ZZ0214-1 TaxID=1077348 RepID=A0A2G8S9T6_9APHY|nr:hypothetical protein GSI_07533 [Ganoderma sinense ZZ0214-1]
MCDDSPYTTGFGGGHKARKLTQWRKFSTARGSDIGVAAIGARRFVSADEGTLNGQHHRGQSRAEYGERGGGSDAAVNTATSSEEEEEEEEEEEDRPRRDREFGGKAPVGLTNSHEAPPPVAQVETRSLTTNPDHPHFRLPSTPAQCVVV